MCVTGAQPKLEQNPGQYKQLVAAEHSPDLMETIQMGTGFVHILYTKVGRKTLRN